MTVLLLILAALAGIVLCADVLIVFARPTALEIFEGKP